MDLFYPGNLGHKAGNTLDGVPGHHDIFQIIIFWSQNFFFIPEISTEGTQVWVDFGAWNPKCNNFDNVDCDFHHCK